MKTYRKRLIVQTPNRVVLSNVPFQPGQEVEVVLRSTAESAADVEALKELFEKTQALPQSQTLTENDIAAEIEAYRTGK